MLHANIFYLEEVIRHCQSYWQRSATRKMTGKYRIAGNFRGSKLSRIHPKNHFCGINFREFYYSAIFNTVLFIIFANFIFANLKKSQKERKLLASKVSGYTVSLHYHSSQTKENKEDSHISFKDLDLLYHLMPSNNLVLGQYELSILKRTFQHTTGFCHFGEGERRCLSIGDKFCSS